MADSVLNRDAGLEAPAWDGVAVTPNDSADLAKVATRALYVSAGGSLRVTMSSGSVLNIATAVEGYHPLRVDRVHATGTTATGIVALY